MFTYSSLVRNKILRRRNLEEWAVKSNEFLILECDNNYLLDHLRLE